MSSEIVLQQLPAKDVCYDLFDGMCVLTSAVEQFFNNKEFTHPELADMFPCDYELFVKNAVTSIPSSLSLPEVTVKRSDIVIAQKSQYSGIQGSVVAPTMTIEFEIKTQTYRMTELMAQELAKFLATMTPVFRNYNICLSTVVCGATQHFRENTPNFFFAKVSATAGMPLAAWTYASTDSILRSIQFTLNIRGGAEAPIALN